MWRGSLAVWDEVYAALAVTLDEVAARGPFVLLDVHSDNHRRDGTVAEPAPEADNPEVNVGTASVDRSLFGPLVERFVRDMADPEYLPEGKKGDTRLFVMNGQPLMHDGQYCAFRRTNTTSDLRSNMSAGGKALKVAVTDQMLEMVEIVRPKLVADGMFLVGLDIVGDKLMEINVFSPGGLGSAQKLTEVNFAPVIIGELERKAKIRQHYPEIDNVTLANG